MKVIILFFFILLFPLFIVAQSFGYIRYYAKYDLVTAPLKVSDDYAEYETEDAWLYFNDTASLFRQRLNATTTQLRRTGNGEVIKNVVMRPGYKNLDTIGALYYRTNEKDTFLCRENFSFSRETYYFYKDRFQHIDWKISNEKKSIGKFVCQKATAFAYGRNWEVWFTSEIPISIGPWKLFGLPGAILEAQDTSKKFIFLFREISLPDILGYDSISMFSQKLNNKFMSKEEFIAFYNKKKEERKSYILSILGEGGGSGSVAFHEEIEQYNLIAK
ncbi:MAG: GLPGLI family protein [Hydrotalea flava]|jgi:GLPGLI family protein|uniref:GLPGLI family protein n=1 Tax=Hydrotalea sp. AMD TaxID=2501297 RepID=UPI0010270208|nr:GLPGLI family protein [Hydrotalea sp. AMD]NIM34793.1 GLPGLI family protein [Hydrotalea flava]NIM38844.1 GLPGLI family protein [Hydrotalea flava]NIN02789.1 GLPGLI family protein [Hydrotalea flava]NIN14474.1 GLPGLI family protein [Hydrotalea flava]NIO94770.1 GLPGLI family protein [Hydrotalea flava]